MVKMQAPLIVWGFIFTGPALGACRDLAFYSVGLGFFDSCGYWSPVDQFVDYLYSQISSGNRISVAGLGKFCAIHC